MKPVTVDERDILEQCQKRILVVDDLPENAKVLESFLVPLGFRVEAAYGGDEALALVEQSPPDVVLLDLMMPGLSGFDVCRHLKGCASTRHIPVIIVTGLSDKEANVKAVEAGADDFLIKPFDRFLLQARIKTSLKAKVLQDQLIGYKNELEERVKERTRQVELTQQVTVFSLARLAESRDTETGDHLERMRSYAREIAVGFLEEGRFRETVDEGFVEELYQSSPLHDIGKVGIPDSILLKPGKLSKEEFEIMKTHSMIGGDTLRAADLEAGQNSFLSMGRDIAYYHHERWDGTGYPFGLRGEEIPLAARIVAVADVYDALSSKRPYKEPLDHATSTRIITDGRGSQFDPQVVDVFMAREQEVLRIQNESQGTGAVSQLERLAQAAASLAKAEAGLG